MAMPEAWNVVSPRCPHCGCLPGAPGGEGVCECECHATGDGREAAHMVLPYTALFPPKGHRYFTDERIEELRSQAIAAGQGTVELPALSLMELICDWRNMRAAESNPDLLVALAVEAGVLEDSGWRMVVLDRPVMPHAKNRTCAAMCRPLYVATTTTEVTR